MPIDIYLVLSQNVCIYFLDSLDAGLRCHYHQNIIRLRTAILTLTAFTTFGCAPANQVDPRLSEQMPPKILWAWERPEDLRFAAPGEFGVAFLAQTIYLQNDDVTPRRRRQPLEVSPGTYLIAVTRIETAKPGEIRPTLSSEMAVKTADLIKNTLELPGVRSVQVDFDAVASEREFYRNMMTELRRELPVETPLTMTTLASWCVGDTWFNDLPVDEAVPMAFNMGADDEKIRNFLRAGNDWLEPLCRGSYGISLDDPLRLALKPGRRVYYFKDTPWTREDLQALN